VPTIQVITASVNQYPYYQLIKASVNQNFKFKNWYGAVPMDPGSGLDFKLKANPDRGKDETKSCFRYQLQYYDFKSTETGEVMSI
jgi:hypothetical protein